MIERHVVPPRDFATMRVAFALLIPGVEEIK
jgi:hypothetical protein